MQKYFVFDLRTQKKLGEIEIEDHIAMNVELITRAVRKKFKRRNTLITDNPNFSFKQINEFKNIPLKNESILNYLKYAPKDFNDINNN